MTALFGGLMLISMLGYLGMFAYQCYGYLRVGYWTAISATDACANWLHIAWCGWPMDWNGLHAGIAWFNPAGFLLFVFIVLTCGSAAIEGASR